VLYPLSYGGRCIDAHVDDPAGATRTSRGHRVRLAHCDDRRPRQTACPTAPPNQPDTKPPRDRRYCQIGCAGVLGFFLNDACAQLPGYSGVVAGLLRRALMNSTIRLSVAEFTNSW
jgi:hypothetical protein